MTQVDLIIYLIGLGLPADYAEGLVRFDFKAGLDLLNKLKKYDKENGGLTRN